MKAKSHRAREHSPVGSSGCARWLACPGSVAACEGKENRSSKYAEEGTNAHYFAEYCLRRGIWEADTIVGMTYKDEGETHEMTEEMADAIQVYLNYLQPFMKKAPTGETEVMVERTFRFPWISKKMWGTADCVIVDHAKRTAQVIDYKHGSGVAVSAEGNAQLLYLAAGLLGERPFSTKTLTLGIIQPRAREGIQLWPVSAKVVRDWTLQVLVPGVKAALAKGAPRRAGAHCRFCPAQGTCPTHKAWALELAKAQFAEPDTQTGLVLPPPATLPPAEMAKVLGYVDVLVSWAKDVQALAQELAEKGESIPGYKLVLKRSMRRWSDEDAAAEKLQSLLGPEAWAPRKLLSVAQAEKALKKRKIALEEALVTKPDNGYHLVPDSDTRPGVAIPVLDMKTAFQEELSDTQPTTPNPTNLFDL